MFTVTNVSETTQRFNVRDPQGGFFNVNLKPGESGDYDVDANQAKYQEGGPLTARPVEVRPAKARTAKPIEAKADAEPTEDLQEPRAAED